MCVSLVSLVEILFVVSEIKGKNKIKKSFQISWNFSFL